VAIAYKSAGAGGGTETSGASLDLVAPATVDAGDILIAHVTHELVASAPTEPAGWKELYGPGTLGQLTPVGRSWVYGKVAAGSEDGATIGFGTAGGTAGRYGRIYSFSGYVSGAIDEIVVGLLSIPSETTIPLPPVRTYETGALAVALLVQDDNNAFAAAGAVTGGTWAEPVAEFVSTTLGVQGCCVGIQTSTPTGNPGQISGGTANATADEGCSIGLAIHDAPPSGLHMVSAARTQDYAAVTTPRDSNEVLHWLTGDLVIAAAHVGGEATDLNTPTATGLTFGLEIETGDPGGSNADVYLWSAEAGSAGADNLTVSTSAGAGGFGIGGAVLRNHAGVGTAAELSDTTQVINYTRTAAGSGVFYACADFDADPVAGVTLTPADGLPVLIEEFGTSVTCYTGLWFDQGGAGSTNYGTSGAAASTNFAKAAIEILAAGGAVPLVVQDATQAQTADNVDLIQHHVLVVQDASQAQTADNVVVTVPGVPLVVQDAAQAQTADNVDLIQHHVLVVQDATQAQTADNVALTQHHQLAVQDATQAQTADNVALTQHHVLVVQDAAQAQTADNVVVTPHAPGAVQLVVQDALQAQTADNVALTQHHVLVVQDAAQAQTADNVVLLLPAAGAEPAPHEAYLRAPISEAGITGSTGPAAASGGGRGGW